MSDNDYLLDNETFDGPAPVMTDEEKLKACAADNGYMAPQLMPNGRWCALSQMLFTVGIVHGDLRHIDTSISGRFCYHDFTDAVVALAEWKERGFEGKPLNYITEK